LTGRRLGFTLAEIGALLTRPDGKSLDLTRECVTQINLLEQQKRGIETAICKLRQIYTSFYRTLIDPPAKSSR
jgi:DNA-binding transcriptional MerR regulator